MPSPVRPHQRPKAQQASKTPSNTPVRSPTSSGPSDTGTTRHELSRRRQSGRRENASVPVPPNPTSSPSRQGDAKRDAAVRLHAAAEDDGDQGGPSGTGDAGGAPRMPAQRGRHRRQVIRQGQPRLRHQEARRPPLPGPPDSPLFRSGLPPSVPG